MGSVIWVLLVLDSDSLNLVRNEMGSVIWVLLGPDSDSVCVCVGGGRGGGGGGACVRACVCTLLLLSIFLVFERFLAPCFIELLMFYC